MSEALNPYASSAADEPPLVAEVVGEPSDRQAEFVLTLPDLLQYSDFYHARSPAARAALQKAWAIHGFALAVTGVLLCTILNFIAPDVLVPVALIVLAALFGAWCAYPIRYRRTLRRAVQRHYEQTNMDAHLGLQRVTLTPDYFIISKRYSQTITRWQGIAEICVANDAAYIFLSAVQAQIVPQRAFLNYPQFEDFTKTARAFHARALTSR